jgi:hypothetical protein
LVVPALLTVVEDEDAPPEATEEPVLVLPPELLSSTVPVAPARLPVEPDLSELQAANPRPKVNRIMAKEIETRGMAPSKTDIQI